MGEGIADYIDLREGDLRETLKQDLPEVDLVLLDSECCLPVRPFSRSEHPVWAPLAHPALQLIEPHLRSGSVIFCDNSVSSSSRYADLQSYMREPANGYTNITVPYHNGLEMSVFVGK